jgi:hypothetical protein
MKKVVALLALMVGMGCFGGEAKADPVKVGGNFDLGAPDGIAFGVDVKPGIKWLSLGAAFTDNILAPGVRGSLVLLPIKFPVMPEFAVDVGHEFNGDLPVGNKPGLSYSYLNLQPGVSFGSRDGFRFFIRGGVSYIDLQTSNFQNVVSFSGVSLENPNFHGWFFPSGKIGFALFF